MKFGNKANLITAYSALFTVAVGVLIYASIRHEPARAAEPVAQENAGIARLAKAAVTDSSIALQ